MRRRITKVVVFLLLGAIVNVAVAWGCARFFSPRSKRTIVWPDGTFEVVYPPEEIVHGWPLLGLTSEWPDDRGVTVWALDFGDEVLPLIPLWPGFAINTIFYAAILWIVTLGPFAARRMIRRKRGRCIKCGYDLRGSSGGGGEVCPECGCSGEAG